MSRSIPDTSVKTTGLPAVVSIAPIALPSAARRGAPKGINMRACDESGSDDADAQRQHDILPVGSECDDPV